MKTIITESIELAADFLNKGEIIALPTETVYGLAARIDNEKALSKIFLAKKRPADNPLIVHISSLEQLNFLVKKLTKEAELLMQSFFPGPLTLICESNKNISPLISAGLPTIAIRQPNHSVALKLIQTINMPLAAPSANLSGKPSATKAEDVLEDFEGIIPCILKGESVYGLESTVINCTQKGQANILRLGSIPFEALQAIIPYIQINKNNSSASPGTKYKHYAPSAQVKLIESINQIDNYSNSSYIGFEQAPLQIKKYKIVNSLEEYALNLFAFFRECDRENIKIIFCERPINQGLGMSLRDRLEKASS